MISFKKFLQEAALKLGGGTNRTAALEAFMTEFEEHTEPNPFAPRIRIWKDSIGFELSKFDGSIHISGVFSFSKKNTGEGSKGLKWLTDLADKHGVKMDLAVQPMKNAGAREGKDLNKAQLKAWYKRNGFVSAGGYHMYREPKK